MSSVAYIYIYIYIYIHIYVDTHGRSVHVHTMKVTSTKHVLDEVRAHPFCPHRHPKNQRGGSTYADSAQAKPELGVASGFKYDQVAI